MGEAAPVYYARPLPQPSLAQRARRGAEVAGHLARRAAPTAVHQRHDPAALRDPVTWAPGVQSAFQAAGGAFVKFGQIVASAPGLFGVSIADAFRSCLDTGPPVEFAEVRGAIEVELGQPLRAAYATFDPEPIGRASIAVVHRATLHSGQPVAVKVVRPDVARRLATDLDLMEPLFALLVRHTGDQLAGATLQQLDGLRQQVGEELDLRNEARALRFFGPRLQAAGFDRLVLPRVYPDLSSRGVLTMEYLDGVPIDDPGALAEIDGAALVTQLIHGFFHSVAHWRTFHGDLHAGNLLLLPGGRAGIIDWGIVGRLDPPTHRYVLRTLAAVLGESGAWDEVTAHLLSVYGPVLREVVGLDDAALAQFLRGMVEPILLAPYGEASIARLMDVAQGQVARAHGVDFKSRSARDLWRRLRLQRRIHRMALDGGGLMSEFDRGNFLLTKQLLYFERYGQRYLKGRPIVEDRAFFTALLDAADPGRYHGAFPPEEQA